MPGIGGTGVVTVSQVLQMAALLDGRHAAGVEQTGSGAEGRAGRLRRAHLDRTNRGGACGRPRSVDVLLGFDLLGAASPANLAVTDPERTVAVVNTGRVPTAAWCGTIA